MGREGLGRETTSLTSTRTELRGTLHPATEEVIELLAGIPKVGYGEAKMTPERISTLLEKFPDLDHAYQAESLRDWEVYGANEGKPTKDGVARFRNWLKNCSTPTRAASNDPHDFIAEAGYKILAPGEHL